MSKHSRKHKALTPNQWHGFIISSSTNGHVTNKAYPALQHVYQQYAASKRHTTAVFHKSKDVPFYFLNNFIKTQPTAIILVLYANSTENLPPYLQDTAILPLRV